MAILPIIVNEKGDVSLYQTVAEAALALEATDVRSGEYRIFDAEGRVIIPKVAGDGIHVELLDSQDFEPDQLQSTLRRFLSQLDETLTKTPEEEIWRSSLPKLIAILIDVQARPHHSRLRLWPWKRSLN
jgi:hypothetical protein